MTIEEARKILGNDFENVNDEELQELIYLLIGLCNHIINNHLSEK